MNQEDILSDDNIDEKEEKQTSTEDDLANYIKNDIPANEIDSLLSAQNCLPFFQLFKELTRTNVYDFFVKMAFLLQLASDKNKTSWTPQEMVNEFHWAQETVRKKIVQQLSRGGWLFYKEGVYQISRFGKSILSILAALPKNENLEDALGANVSSLSLLESYPEENLPENNLRMFINELIKIDEDIESTMASKSEYLIRKLNKQVRSQFDVAIKSREYLQNLRSETFHNYRLKQQIHEKLSNFHSRVSQVQRAQNDLVARKIILTDKSLTQHDVNTFLINTNIEKLASLGRKHMAHPISAADLVPALLVYETEWQFDKERPEENRRSWSQNVEVAAESEENITENNRFFGFIAEIDYSLDKNSSLALEKFVPYENWSTSGFRFSMIAVLEHSELPKDMDIENKESVPRLTVDINNEGLEIDVAVLNDHMTGVKEISKGVISREKKE